MGERSRVRTVLAVVTGFVVVAGLVITSGTSGSAHRVMVNARWRSRS